MNPKPFETLVTSKPPPFLQTLKELWEGRGIAIILIKTELSVQYKQTLLGILWFLLRPLATVAIFATIFSYIVRFPVGDTPYAVFIVCGIVPWMYFLDAIQKGMRCLQGNASIITRIYFPRLLLPICAVISPLLNLAVGMSVLVLIMLLYGVSPSPNIVFLPLFFLLMSLFTLALSLCLAGPQAIFRDIGILFGLVLTLWMYVTPIIYPLHILPPFLQDILIYNPLTGIVSGLRWSIIGYSELNVHALVISVVATALLFGIGMRLFRSMETYYIDQV